VIIVCDFFAVNLRIFQKSLFLKANKGKLRNRVLLGSSSKCALQVKSHPDILSLYSYFERLARVKAIFDK